MISALVLLVVGLSLPTIIHLSALLKKEPGATTGASSIGNYGD